MERVQSWGVVRVILHWLVAVIVIALYLIGDYMVGLDYYDSWYQLAPFLHKSFGVLVLLLMVVRLLLKVRWKSPEPLTHNAMERVISLFAHLLLYMLVIGACISGYLISTADGRPVSVFEIFELPALSLSIQNQEDLAGVWHYWIATVLMVLAGVHALAALKHHLIDKDDTLKRMLRLKQLLNVNNKDNE